MNDSQSAPRRGSEKRRQQLLDIARGLFIRDGYAGTPISAIVSTAGVAQGTFYVYFKSKQAVLAELRRGVFKRYAAALAEVGAQPGPADERLVRVVLAMVDVVRDELELERVFREAESAESLERAALEGRARLAATATRLLEDGIAAGTLRAERPALTAQLLVTLFDTVLFESLAYGQPGPVDSTVDQALRLVLRGIAVPEPRIAELLALHGLSPVPEDA